MARRIGRVVRVDPLAAPSGNDESPQRRERREKVEAERRLLSRRIAQAAQTAARFRNDLDRLKEALRPIDDEVRDIEAQGHIAEVTTGLSALALVSAGAPFCSRGLADLIAQLEWFLAGSKPADSRMSKRRASPTSLDNNAILFELAFNVAELEARGIPVKPKDLAAAEVIATGKVHPTPPRAANAIRAWERRLAKAREVLPGFRRMFDIPGSVKERGDSRRRDLRKHSRKARRTRN
jgi:hypothetical protein